MTEQEKEETQPVVVNADAPPPAPKEGTEPVEVPTDEPQTQVPDWLLKFASSPEQSADETDDLDELDVLSSFSDDPEEVEAFVPPDLSGENGWQELSEYRDQDPLDLDPIDVSEESTVEEQTSEIQESVPEAEPVNELAESLTLDPHIQAAENFGQEIRGLLKQGQSQDAIALIREKKTDPLFVATAKKTLRSQLTLSSKASDLWEIYDELNSPSD